MLAFICHGLFFAGAIRERPDPTCIFKLITSAENQWLARIAQNYAVRVSEIGRIALRT